MHWLPVGAISIDVEGRYEEKGVNMELTRKRLKVMLARARKNGFDTGYRMADMNWKIAMAEWGREFEKDFLPTVLIEAGEILRAKSEKRAQVGEMRGHQLPRTPTKDIISYWLKAKPA